MHLTTGLYLHRLSPLQAFMNSSVILINLTSHSVFPFIYQSLHCLPLAQQIQFRIPITAYEAIHNFSIRQFYINISLSKYHPHHPLCSYKDHLLSSFLPSFHAGLQDFSRAFPFLLNIIPQYVWLSPTLSKQSLSTHFFWEAYTTST